MIAEKIPELKHLSSEEKLILVGELWDELAADTNAFPPREDHIKLLQDRLDHFRQHPEDTIAWEDVKSRILASRRVCRSSSSPVRTLNGKKFLASSRIFAKGSESNS